MKKDYKKNCTQVSIPQVDNSSPCEDFNWTECIISNRNSNLVKIAPESNLNEYLDLLEKHILKMQNTIASLTKKVQALQECCGKNQSSGIGTF